MKDYCESLDNDDLCMQKCESCDGEFDIETMVQGEQWFCQECYDVLSEDEEFARGSYLYDLESISGAYFSLSRKFRYSLWRIWDASKPKVMFIGLNPSTANETDSDPTIRSVMRIAKHNGYGGVYMMNCFPLVSTDPRALKAFESTRPSYEVEDRLNLKHLLKAYDKCEDVVFAWGNFKEAELSKEFLEDLFPGAKCLHRNKNGSPKHPLYCKSETKLIPWKQVS